MKSKKDSKKIAALIALTILGGVFGYFIGKMIGGGIPSKNTISPLIIFAMIIPSWFLTVAWHEAGHALAGVKVGFDFRMYVVGPFLWEKQNTTWRFQWNKDINKSGGLVLCLPTDTQDLTRKFSIFAVAGPLSSVLLTMLASGLWFLTQSNLSLQILNLFFGITGLMSFVIFIATSIPSKMGGFYSDGARFLRLQRGGDAARFEVLTMSIIANTTNGIRPKLLDMNQLVEMQQLAIKRNEPFGVYVHSFFHQAAFDKGEIDQAEKHLLDYINEADNIPQGIRNGVWLDAAFFYAYAKRDLAEAEKYWHIFKPSAIISKSQIMSTEAILSFLKHDNEKALSKINMAVAELPNMIDKGIAVALRDKLEALRTEIVG